jgi:hypothetical protein
MGLSIILHDMEKRHPGLTPNVAAYYCEAAGVCLDRHHSPPHGMTVTDNGASQAASVAWTIPDARVKAAWANADDATRDGAYAVALAAVEAARGLLAVSRAETKSGCDYYVDLPTKPVLDLETAVRLEVSGTDKGDHAAINKRVQIKIKQALAGKSPLPAIAAVVGFATSVVVTADV